MFFAFARFQALSQAEVTPEETSALDDSSSGVLVRNVALLMGSQLTTWGLSLVALIAIPRYLGSELVGRFHLANSLWAVGLAFSSFGTSLAVTKAVARDGALAGPQLASSIAVRVLFLVPVTVALFVYARLVGYTNDLLVVIALVGVGSLVLTVADAYSAVLQGFDRMGAVSLASILGRLAFVVGALVGLELGYSLALVAMVAGLGSLVTLLVQVGAFHRLRLELDYESPITTDLASIWALIRTGSAYFSIFLFIALYQQVDTFVISIVVETEEVLGWYSIYDRLAGTMLFVPAVFMTAVYPTLSRVYDSEADSGPRNANRLTQKTFETMLLISVPIGFGIAAIARPLVILMFGEEFSSASQVVAVGGFVISLTYLTTILGIFIIAMDKEREWTRFIAVGAILTIPLDFFLVPFFQSAYGNGAIGGPVAYLVTESLILAGAVHLLPKGALGPQPLLFAGRVALAGLGMVLVVVFLRQLNLMVPILAGGVTYMLMVMVLRLVGAEEREMLRSHLPGNKRLDDKSV